MKLIRREDENFVFRAREREKQLLLEILRLYPLIPAAHHRVTKMEDGTKSLDAQKLLEEALAAHRRANQKQLIELLGGETGFQEDEGGHRFTLTAPQMEWLLQVSNDIRVGSWLALGQPDETEAKPAELTPENMRYYVAMEFCALLQFVLLEALNRRS